MSDKIFMKGCEAVAETAVRAGCRFFAGYPITPQNDVPEYFARRMPQVNGVFIQGESEVASANMAYGAAAAGVRSMTSSSSCGISLKSEAISWMAGARLPVVIANFQRGGPGIGSIQPAQQDYTQATKASGNGGFKMLVLSPSTLQEAVDMTYRAFDLADKYANPVLLLMDGFTGTMMEPVLLPEQKTDEELLAIRASKTWAAVGRHGGEQHKVMCGPGLDARVSQQDMNKRDAKLYESWQESEVEYETYLTEDAELIITAYGISGRIARSAVSMLRAEGYKVGLIRPLKVYPFPAEAYDRLDYKKLRGILCAEMAIPAQFAVDVDNVVRGRTKIGTALSSGGDILDRGHIIEQAKRLYGEI
ncbi:MAG: 3-methyl-2-oxobutanoate dehydrogenase subunit VorB [Oscillospiraceae bacterium]